MTTGTHVKQKLDQEGYAVINDVFTKAEIIEILSTISRADTSKSTFRKTDDLFAIRRFFLEVPAAVEGVFTETFLRLLAESFGTGYFVAKSIYFDKPESSNWFVAYHQDLTISVDKKADVDGFGPWTTKPGGFAVQPPIDILQDNLTVRIHLDNTNEDNGALKVIPGSHVKGICKSDTIKSLVEAEAHCRVQKGGVMFMKPLLLHASGRTTNGKRRRVIHIEFSRSPLPGPLQWAERMPVNYLT